MFHETVLLLWRFRNNIITVALLGEAESSKGCDHDVCLCALYALGATVCHYVHCAPPLHVCTMCQYVHCARPLHMSTITMCTMWLCVTMYHLHVHYVLASVPPLCAMLPHRPPAVHTTCVLDGDGIPSYPIISYHTTPHVPLLWLLCHSLS